MISAPRNWGNSNDIRSQERFRNRISYNGRGAEFAGAREEETVVAQACLHLSDRPDRFRRG